MGAAAVLAPVFVALASGAVDVETGVTTQGRMRGLYLEGQPARNLLQMELVPHADLGLKERGLTLAAKYALRLYSPDVFGNTGGAPLTRTILLNVLALRGETPLPGTPAQAPGAGHGAGSPHELASKISFGVDGAWGWTDLLDEKIWSPEAVPTTTRLQYVSTSGDAAVRIQTSRRLRMTVGAAAFLSGGADAGAREQIPLQRGFRATYSLERNATRRDVLELRLHATEAWFTTGATSGYLLAAGSWKHQVTPTFGTSTGLGVAAAISHEPQRRADVTQVPWAEFMAAWTPGGTRPSTALTLRIEPVVDRLTATVAGRGEAIGAVKWVPAREWHFEGRATTAASPMSSRVSTVIGAAELRAGRDLTRNVSVDAGVYGRWQHSRAPTLPSFVEWGVFLAALARSGGR